MNGNDPTTTFIFNKGYEFLKKGNFTMSLSMNEDTLLGKIRKSDVFNFKIINGDKAFLSPYYSFENHWMINKEHIIKGVNFDIKYTFENSLCYCCHIERSEISVVVRLKQMFQFVQHNKYHKLNTDGYLIKNIDSYLAMILPPQ